MSEKAEGDPVPRFEAMPIPRRQRRHPQRCQEAPVCGAVKEGGGLNGRALLAGDLLCEGRGTGGLEGCLGCALFLGQIGRLWSIWGDVLRSE